MQCWTVEDIKYEPYTTIFVTSTGATKIFIELIQSIKVDEVDDIYTTEPSEHLKDRFNWKLKLMGIVITLLRWSHLMRIWKIILFTTVYFLNMKKLELGSLSFKGIRGYFISTYSCDSVIIKSS